MAAATRAWYLPTCVNCAMPVTSPIAQTSSAARRRSSTVDAARRDVHAEVLEAEPVDVRAAAGRDEQRVGVDRSPPARSTRIPGSTARRRHRAARRSRLTEHVARAPRRRRRGRARAARRRARRSSPPRRSARRTARARSRPVHRRGRRGCSGTWCARVASRFVQYSTSSMPSTGGIAGPEPVATTSRSYSKLLRHRPRGHPPAPRGPRLARAGSSTPGGSGAGRNRPSRSSSSRAIPRHPPGRVSPAQARVRGRATQQLGRAQHRLRRHAREVRALAADERLSTSVTSASESCRRRAPTKCSPVDPRQERRPSPTR